MRLTRKFLAAFMIAAMIVLAVYASVLVNREVSFFDDDMRRDATFAGNTLARAVEKTWEREGEAAALSLIHQTDLNIRHIQIRWAWLDEAAVFKRFPSDARAAALRGETVSERMEQSGKNPGALYTYVPVVTNTTRH